MLLAPIKCISIDNSTQLFSSIPKFQTLDQEIARGLEITWQLSIQHEVKISSNIDIVALQRRIGKKTRLSSPPSPAKSAVHLITSMRSLTGSYLINQKLRRSLVCTDELLLINQRILHGGSDLWDEPDPHMQTWPGSKQQQPGRSWNLHKHPNWSIQPNMQWE